LRQIGIHIDTVSFQTKNQDKRIVTFIFVRRIIIGIEYKECEARRVVNRTDYSLTVSNCSIGFKTVSCEKV